MCQRENNSTREQTIAGHQKVFNAVREIPAPEASFRLLMTKYVGYVVIDTWVLENKIYFSLSEMLWTNFQ